MSEPAPRLIAHRGGAALGPENTVQACAAAWNAGFRGFEVDAKLSRDGTVFLLHDDTLDRTTTARGRASSLDWASLQQRCAAEVDTLSSLAAWCAAHPCWVNVEIKPDADADTATQRDWGARIASACARLWPQRPPLLSSFSVPALQGAARAAPQLARAWLGQTLPPDWRELAQSLGLQAIHLDAQQAQRDDLGALHAAGLQLRLYTVNEPLQAQRWLDDGVDAVFSDGWMPLALR